MTQTHPEPGPSVLPMTKKQLACVAAMERLLERCKKVGLQGGVFDGTFCLWPEKGPHPADGKSSWDFFDRVKEFGVIIHTNMSIDGGSGA
jgi:hypothetical protein